MRKTIALSILFISIIMLSAFQPPSKTKKIIFFGDSITQAAVEGDGYIVQARKMLKDPAAFELIGSGIGGNKVYDLYLRMEHDVLNQKPDAVFIYIGVNDVWHKAIARTGTDADKFVKFYQAIIDKLRQAKIQPVLCTLAVIGEKNNGTNEMDKELDQYADLTRNLAAKNQLPLVDLRKTFMEHYQSNNPGNADKGILTTDGVHLNAAGNKLVASKMLEALYQLHW